MDRTRYVKTSDGTNIAYRVIGDGPIDIVYVPGWVSNVETLDEPGPLRTYYERFASFSRLILFDKRGTGASDRVSPNELPSIEQRMDDLRAVMDALSLERATVVGVSEGGPMSIVFAATFPDRVTALVLYGSFAKVEWTDSLVARIAGSVSEAEERIEQIWGTDALGAEIWTPTVAHIPLAAEAVARHQRSGASPAAARALFRIVMDTDVRHVLPTLNVPTLVLHAAGDRAVGVTHGRYLAEHIRGARYIELPGDDHVIVHASEQEAMIGAIRQFLTGAGHLADADRVLATVLFTDIVDSTRRAAELGDAQWRRILDLHDQIVRSEVATHRGRVVKSTGDGVLATFDGPARGVRCARAMTDAVSGLGIEIRCGLHTGEIELRGDDVGGIAVHIASRVEARGRPGEVLVSRTVVDLVAGSGLRFDAHGEHELKGVPGRWSLYSLN
jgi:class 3 adenylate cyclase